MKEIALSNDPLPVLVQRAATHLASATTAAEVLEARDMASFAYDIAKKIGRLARAKAAHDEVVVKAMQAQGDAVEIECLAKQRLAEEYDAAQERGEITTHGGDRKINLPDGKVEDIGLSYKEVHDARLIRDAEKADPGIIKRTVDRLLANGEEPTRAAVKREIVQTPPKPTVSPASLWLWGRLRDFQRDGYFEMDPHKLLLEMTPQMREDVADVLPHVCNFLKRLENAGHDNA